MIKTLNIDTEGICLNLIKAEFDKTTVNTILSGDKLGVFPQKSGIR